jgi:hypothetical protein
VTKEEEISPEDQKEYHAGVGTLLYLIKYSRHDIANVVHEQAKCLEKVTPAAFKETKRDMWFIYYP